MSDFSNHFNKYCIKIDIDNKNIIGILNFTTLQKLYCYNNRITLLNNLHNSLQLL